MPKKRTEETKEKKKAKPLDKALLKELLNATEASATLFISDIVRKVGGTATSIKALAFDYLQDTDKKIKLKGGRSGGRTVKVSKAGSELVIRLNLKNYQGTLIVAKGDEFTVVATSDTITLTKSPKS